MLRSTAMRATRAASANQVMVRPVRGLASRSNEPPLEQGIIDKYQLNEPSRFVPIALGAGLFASVTGLYVRWDCFWTLERWFICC